MTYQTHSIHAQTGASAAAQHVVSPNEYAPEGRNISYPTNFDIYVVKISDVDGSVQVNGEPHTVDQLVGNRLYLYHRPMIQPDGTVATVTSSAGTVTQANTNAKQGYIEYSSTPTADFTVSYLAAPDCFNQWQLNKLQDSIMEVQGQLGATNQTGWAGLRTVNAVITDTPTDAINTLLPNLVSLPNLETDLRISSSDVTALTGTLGDRRKIQIGRSHDDIHFEGTGITLGSVAGYAPDDYADIWISNRTGDRVYCAGTFSGHDQMTVGGVNAFVGNYSGLVLSSATSGEFYTGAMLRVHGDTYIQGDIETHGTLTLVTTTGETSTVLGDFTIHDELFVYGVSHLIGPTETNDLRTFQDHTLDGNLIAKNLKGAGDRGHSLVDNLDASEIAHTYKTVNRKNLDNYIVSAPKTLDRHDPTRVVWGSDYTLSGSKVAGDVFGITGFFTAAASESGSYTSILQLQFTSGTLPVVSGFNDTSVHGSEGMTATGFVDGGIYSRSLVDAGSLWVEVLAPSSAAGYRAPIFGHTIQEVQGNHLTKLNVYTPAPPDNVITAHDNFLLYSPGCEYYDYITSTDGSDPSVTVNASTDSQIHVAFEDEVRIFDANSSATSIKTALQYSSSGGYGTSTTGVAYIFASMKNVDIEANPTVVARPTPFRMPNETIIGEVVATGSDTFGWIIAETTSYRPGGLYDSAWIPIHSGDPYLSNAITHSGRMISYFEPNATGNQLFFNHNLGAGLNFSDVNTTLYLASYGGLPTDSIHINKHRSSVQSLWGHDFRGPVGLSGSFTSMSLNKDSVTGASAEASVFFMDGRVIGIQFTDDVLDAPEGSDVKFDHLRLVMKRTS